MYIGADYYPEHVPPEQWEKDASLMHDAGFNVTRLAEFAWIFISLYGFVFAIVLSL